MTEAAAPFTRQYATIDEFIARWQASGAGERANYQLFLSELAINCKSPVPSPPVPTTGTTPVAKAKQPWPKSLPEQVRAIRAALADQAAPATAKVLAQGFERVKADKIHEILETLASLGQAREVGAGTFIV